MPIHIKEDVKERWVELHITGKLTEVDYEQFAVEAERLIRAHGKVDLLCEVVDFQGWKVAAALEDLKFGVLHSTEIRHIAMVGEHKWCAWMEEFCQPFSEAEVRCFEYRYEDQGEDLDGFEQALDQACLEAARRWLGEQPLSA